MTVSSTENRKEYNGNGVTVAFSFPYRFLADEDLTVYVDGDLMTLTTDYTIVGAGEDAGGTVTMLVAPVTGTNNVVIVRDPEATQELDLVENDPLPAEDVETAFDKLTMLHQRLGDLLERAVVLSDADPSATLVIPNLADRAGNLLGFDDNGDLVAFDPVDIDPDIVSPFMADLLDDVDAAEARATLGAAGTGVANTFTEDQTFDQDVLVEGSATVNGPLAVETISTSGNATLGNATGDSHTINGSASITNGLTVTGDPIRQASQDVMGYSTGAGGSVTQATSKATAVTLNSASGRITMNSSVINANSAIEFIFNNSLLDSAMTIYPQIIGGVASANSYLVGTRSLATGSVVIGVRNLTAGNLSEAIDINFELRKIATA
jgi:hypothetical protein